MNSPSPQEQISVLWSDLETATLPNLEAYTISLALERIKRWVGDQTALTEILCTYIVQSAAKIPEGQATAAVDAIVHKEILKNWQDSLAAPHLKAIEDELLAYDRRDSLLILYIQILQRGGVPTNNSPEQSVLLASGLVKLQQERLVLANRLYGKVFGLSWVERQLPGITRPVEIVSTQPAAPRRALPSVNLPSRVAIALLGLAVVGTAVSSYIRESGGPAMARAGEERLQAASTTASETSSSGAAVSKADGAVVEPETVASDIAQKATSDRERFDNGGEHAKNSRWVLMMREFCGISTESAYFLPAQSHLEQLMTLYAEDVDIAMDIVAAEKGGRCAIADAVSAQ